MIEVTHPVDPVLSLVFRGEDVKSFMELIENVTSDEMQSWDTDFARHLLEVLND